ncbi:hypothetical protein GCM10023186_25020 [Hymenobacter koreensis]|uniref:Uncharacterized protein n=1 Tax=Hymenobacter koreensis TaxID=1084523 RepID=A0ABP8J246_9BACT
MVGVGAGAPAASGVSRCTCSGEDKGLLTASELIYILFGEPDHGHFGKIQFGGRNFDLISND